MVKEIVKSFSSKGFPFVHRKVSSSVRVPTNSTTRHVHCTLSSAAHTNGSALHSAYLMDNPGLIKDLATQEHFILIYLFTNIWSLYSFVKGDLVLMIFVNMLSQAVSVPEIRIFQFSGCCLRMCILILSFVLQHCFLMYLLMLS